MFLLKTLYRIVTLRPMYFTKDIMDKIRNEVNLLIEGKYIAPHGFVVCIDEVLKILPLQVDEEGHALFKVKLSALVFKPYIGEVIDVVVESVNNSGVNANAGLFSMFLPTEQIYSRLKALSREGALDVAGSGGGDYDDKSMFDGDDLMACKHEIIDDNLRIYVNGTGYDFGAGTTLRVRISKVQNKGARMVKNN